MTTAIREQKTDYPLPVKRMTEMRFREEDETFNENYFLSAKTIDWQYMNASLERPREGIFVTSIETSSVQSKNVGHTQHIVYPELRKSPIEAQFDHLKRLKDGWDGRDATAPSAEAIHDLECVKHVLGMCKAPTIEIEDEGGISLSWSNTQSHSEFTLTFRGTGRVVGTLVSLSQGGNVAWRLPVSIERELVNRLQEADVEALIT